ELEEYIQELPGEPTYEDPATIWVPVDRNTWPETKKLSLLEFVATLHLERGPATVDSVSIVAVYGTPMTVANYYLRIDAWRTVTIPGVGDVIENIPFTDYVKTLGGFTLTLSSYVAGDIVDFFAYE
ncbi:MAG: hypothetical protein KAS32_28630, partial [Candidatus Peribacteraceae bacterium]|nr:hypothetical protein [Candidatus Peribacteraceae bacterium]